MKIKIIPSMTILAVSALAISFAVSAHNDKAKKEKLERQSVAEQVCAVSVDMANSINDAFNAGTSYRSVRMAIISEPRSDIYSMSAKGKALDVIDNIYINKFTVNQSVKAAFDKCMYSQSGYIEG